MRISVCSSRRPHTQTFWRGLLAQQRARFLRHVRSYWEVVRHRVAPEVGELLDGLQALGQLKVRAARLLRAGLRVNSADALIRERGKEHNQVEQYDYVIRATGLDTDILCTTHPLASHLREAGLISADTQGLGVNVTDDLEVLDQHGDRIPGLYCVGPLLRGHLWETTAVPELRTAAKTLSQRLRSSEPATANVRARTLERELVLSRGF